jgi:hypothetical protein
MHDTEIMRRLLCTVAAAATAGMLLAASPVLANDDDDAPARDEGIIGNLMRGIGATDGSNGINYRERSPLVVPRQITLPPPASSRPEVSNWPKDPDVLERRARREALRKRDKEKENNPYENIRTQPEPQLGQARARTATVAPQPGSPEYRRIYEGDSANILSPSQLGVTSNLFGLFGGKKNENVPFEGEPARESLTQPPPGYQTPASNHAYGISEADRAKLLGSQPRDDRSNILPPGKY